jgi:hypothetical protein
MKLQYWFNILFSFLTLFNLSSAEAFIFCDRDNWIDLGARYRRDCLEWNIAGPYREPSVLSELKWKDVHSVQAIAAAKITIPTGVYGRAEGAYGHVFEGHVTDADYAGNHRTKLFSHSKSQSKKGHVWDASIGIGYPLLSCFGHFKISPIAGYARNEQQFHIQGGTLWLNEALLGDLIREEENLPSSAPSSEERSKESSSSSSHNTPTTTSGSRRFYKLPDVKSHYLARWYGPWIGVDWDVTCLYKIDFFGSIEGHWASYRGKGHWDKRKDFADDFKHKAHAFGFVLNCGLRWNFTKHLGIALLGGYQNWSSSPGSDTTYFFSGSSEKIHKAKLRLNHVHWESCNIGLSGVFRF